MKREVMTLNDAEIKKAFDQLSDEDKQIIAILALDLEDKLKKRWSQQSHKVKLAFGPKMAIELLCKVSMYMLITNGPAVETWDMGEKPSEGKPHIWELIVGNVER